jgi:hypothetical protein
MAALNLNLNLNLSLNLKWKRPLRGAEGVTPSTSRSLD